MSRSDQYESGFRAAGKRAVTWLHAEAARMNDPKAKGILNEAAYHLGLEFKAATVEHLRQDTTSEEAQ